MKSATFEILVIALVLGGCATGPMRPNVAVMPGPNKPFEVFQQDQAVCEHYADQQSGASQAQASANNTVVGGAVVGTVVGAAAGALLTPRSGGAGAAPGAAIGLLAGSAIGTGNAQNIEISTQDRYDLAYEQCMYAKGNQVPQYYPQPMIVYPAPPPGTVIVAPPPYAPPPPPPNP